MRFLTLVAFLSLQLSVFTCGFDIHVHAASLDTSHVAEHLHDGGAEHDQDSDVHACHVHASHAFKMTDVAQIGAIPKVIAQEHYKLTGLRMKSVAFIIEHPPRTLHS